MLEGILVGAALGVFPEPSADVALVLVVEVEVVTPGVITSVAGAPVRWVVVFEGALVGAALGVFPEVGEVEVVATGAVTLVVGVFVG